MAKILQNFALNFKSILQNILYLHGYGCPSLFDCLECSFWLLSLVDHKLFWQLHINFGKLYQPKIDIKFNSFMSIDKKLLQLYMCIYIVVFNIIIKVHYVNVYAHSSSICCNTTFCKPRERKTTFSKCS